MKKLFFAAFALVAGVISSQAQTEVHPRIEVGANFASGVHKVVGATPESKVRLGFRAGLAAEVGLASGVYLAPGVTFRQEGFKYISEDGYGLNYISVPVDLGIRVPFSENFAVSVEAWPLLRLRSLYHEQDRRLQGWHLQALRHGSERLCRS